MRKVSENEVKDILRNYDRKIESIHQQMLNLYEELDSDSLMSEVAFPAADMFGMSGTKGNHGDLSNVLLAYQSKRYERKTEVLAMMWELTEEEEVLRRVWRCMQLLEYPYYTILNELYVKNQLYYAVEQNYGRSHHTFEKHRKKAVERLLACYHSESDRMIRYLTAGKKTTEEEEQSE